MLRKIKVQLIMNQHVFLSGNSYKQIDTLFALMVDAIHLKIHIESTTLVVVL